MYRKVQEKNETLGEPPKPPQLVPPHERQSFIGCPSCYGKSLVTCGCEIPNYLCQNCEWTHVTHHHKSPEPPGVYGKQTPKLLHTYTLPN